MKFTMFSLNKELSPFDSRAYNLKEEPEILTVCILKYTIAPDCNDMVYIAETPEDLHKLPKGENYCVVCCFPRTELERLAIRETDFQFIFLSKPATLEQVYSLLSAALSAGQRLAALESALFQELKRATNVKNLLQIAFGYLQNSIDVFDAGFKILASVKSGTGAPEGTERAISEKYLDMEIMKLINHDAVKRSDKPILIQNKSLGHDRIVSMIHPNREIGHFVIIGDKRPFTPADYEYAAIFRDALYQFFMRDEFSKNAQGFHYEYFIKDLLDERYAAGVTPHHRQGYLTGSFQPRLFCLVVEAERTPFPLPLESIRVEFERMLPAASVIIYHGQIVAVLSGLSRLSLPREKIEALSAYCEEGKIFCGLSNAFDDILSLHVYYEQALRAIELGAERKGSTGLFIYENYAAAHLAVQFAQKEDPEAFCHPTMKALLEHDRRNGKHLAETLYTYLVFGNPSSTAAALFIHRNTLLYRLNLINDLYDIDYADTNLRLYLILSYQMMLSASLQRRPAE